MKRFVFSGLVLAIPLSAAAYSDVPRNAWFEESVDTLVEQGHLDGAKDTFRPGDTATRAEFIKLVVSLNGGILGASPNTPSFTDVPKSAWYFGVIEEAAKEGWVRGDGNCYGEKTCYAHPEYTISRAEAATLLVRAFALEATGEAPKAPDVADGKWYTEGMRIAADYCIVQGDDATGRARPADTLNRAEMAKMLLSASSNGSTGYTCGVCGSIGCDGSDIPLPRIKEAFFTGSNDGMFFMEAEFYYPVMKAEAEDVTRYSLGGLDGKLAKATLVAPDTVELQFSGNQKFNDCENPKPFTLEVKGIHIEGGDEFSDTYEGRAECIIADDFSNYQLELNLGTLPDGNGEHGIRQGDEGITVFPLHVTAGCEGTQVVRSMRVHHHGSGSSLDLTNVYASHDGKIIGTGIYDWRDRSWLVDFTERLEIPACATTSLQFSVDFSSKALPHGNHTLKIIDAKSITSDGVPAIGNFPIIGPMFRVY